MRLKEALHTITKSPAVTIIATLSLALGIGATAAIFSIFHQTVLRALPVQNPDELVNLSAPGAKTGSTSCGKAGGCVDIFSFPMFRDLIFAGILAIGTGLLFGIFPAMPGTRLDLLTTLKGQTAVLLTLVAMGAGLMPARQAAKVAPMEDYGTSRRLSSMAVSVVRLSRAIS
jgi:hypothetical protein